ncbi:uncharacterized protein [Zea mays]|uniref:uncharacterized protein isoform X2 n=1 Tax=Zea mays TaxID=4577 RepID=UPI0004DE800E|nr:uncharacterized protein LOC103641194 isoform X2 [Zea mays]|eukprot:XP_008662782.1 uncharacterized protein LOC103641194 isoform X2 [Zea mays]
MQDYQQLVWKSCKLYLPQAFQHHQQLVWKPCKFNLRQQLVWKSCKFYLPPTLSTSSTTALKTLQVLSTTGSLLSKKGTKRRLQPTFSIPFPLFFFAHFCCISFGKQPPDI